MEESFECPECGMITVKFTSLSYQSSTGECNNIDCDYSETFP